MGNRITQGYFRYCGSNQVTKLGTCLVKEGLAKATTWMVGEWISKGTEIPSPSVVQSDCSGTAAVTCPSRDWNSRVDDLSGHWWENSQAFSTTPQLAQSFLEMGYDSRVKTNPLPPLEEKHLMSMVEEGRWGKRAVLWNSLGAEG